MPSQYRRYLRSRGKIEKLPECFGHYAAGDPQCDGLVLCAVKGLCRPYRDWCHKRGVDPVAFRSDLSTRDLVRFTLALKVPRSRQKDDFREREWARFRAALADVLPCQLHSSKDLALPGEAYWAEWKDKKRPDTLVVGRIYIRGCKRKTKQTKDSDDVTLIRYMANSYGMAPSIELRVPLDILLEKYPEAKVLAERWQITSSQGIAQGPLGALAVHVPIESLEDVARLVVVALRDGVTRSLTMKGNQIWIDWNKMKLNSIPCFAEIITKRKEMYEKWGKHQRRWFHSREDLTD